MEFIAIGKAKRGEGNGIKVIEGARLGVQVIRGPSG